MRVYLAGHGSIADRHARNLRLIDPDVEILLQRPRREVTGELADCELVDSASEAIDRGVDFGIVASSTTAHISSLVPLINANLPMYVEKPVVSTREQLTTIAELVSSSNYSAPSLVGCNLRFLPSLQIARQMITDGELGRVTRGLFEAGQWLPDWRPSRDYRLGYSASAEQGGGVVLDLVHEIDAARWILGDFDRVVSDVAHRSSLDIETEDTAGILMSRQGGPLAMISIDYVSRRPVRRYSIVGEAGTLTWNLQERTLVLSVPDGESLVPLEDKAFDVSQTYIVALRELVAAIQAGDDTSQPLGEGLASLDLALKTKGQ